MHWFKLASNAFSEERNVLNHKIENLEKTFESLGYASKIVHQTSRNAKKTIIQLMDSKFLSNYPEIVDLLSSADKAALDNPDACSLLCTKAGTKIRKLLEMLYQERENYLHNKTNIATKGLLDDGQ
jgi:hypothetical protein